MASTSNAGTTLLTTDPVTIDSTRSSLHPSNIFSVEGLIAVITGGGTGRCIIVVAWHKVIVNGILRLILWFIGIGLMMATALENNGATVYIVGRRLDVLEKAARENNVRILHLALVRSLAFLLFLLKLKFLYAEMFVEQKFDKIIPIEGDVSNRESLLTIVDVVKTRHGYIDLLVNNAGIARNLLPHPLPSPFDESQVVRPPSPPASPLHAPSTPSIKAFQNVLWETGSPEDFAETFAINVTAVYYTTVAFLDLLHQGNVRRRCSEFPMNQNSLSRPPHHTSQVLSISSSGSFRLDPRILSLSYTLAKSACTHLGKLLANLLTPWGIRSNVLAPGVWPTGILPFTFQSVATFAHPVCFVKRKIWQWLQPQLSSLNQMF